MKSSPKPSALNRLQALLLGLVLVGAAWLATVAPQPPAPVPAVAAPGEFSAERALVHVRALAQAAHPLGSPENATVRHYLSNQLSALGLAVSVQPFAWKQTAPNGFNLMARIPGAHAPQEPARALALVSHYDSVPTGPGASDDAAAVAAVLETARALQTGPRLSNDVILLFTDGEELRGDVAGARAFATQCPWMKELGCVFNFEARGVSGPVLMFETGAGNGPLIQAFAAAAPRPVANSLMAAVYGQMPNTTDFTVFREAGVPGLNFAFIGEPQHYHQPTDDVAHLSVRSLQHQGSYALSLARHCGNVDLGKLRGTDAVYFDLLGRVLIHYSSAWALPLALLAVGLFAGVTGWAIKRGEAAPGKLLLAGLAWGLTLLLVGGLFLYGHGFVGRLAPGMPGWGMRQHLWQGWWVALGLTVTLSTTVQLGLGRWLGTENLALGALGWWLLLALAGALWMPGGSFLGLWPLLGGLLGLGLAGRERRGSWRHHVWLAVTALPTLCLVPPLLNAFYVALGLQAVFIPMLGFALVLGALSLQAEAVSRAWAWTLPVAGGLVALVGVVQSHL